MADDDLTETETLAEDIADTLTVSAATFSRVLRIGMRDAVVEGHSLERVLKRAALSISASALSAGLRPLTGAIGGGLSQLMGSLAGAFTGQVSNATKVVPFAEGGVIGSPTAFGLGGGKVGLMGEAGREAILPLARGPDGRLGVALEGASGAAGGAVNVTVNVTTPDAESFRRSEGQMTAMLARAVARGRRGL